MRYLPKSDSERHEMLKACGLSSLDDLVAHLPPEVLQKQALELPPGKSEYEIMDYFRARGERMANGYASFLGGGVYRHYRPVLADVVVSRSEFLTSYTPYQAEISQGTLVTIFEFQTMICQLTGMEVANASMYDGSTAVPEAALMAARVTRRKKILVARGVHPEYRDVLTSSVKHQDLPVVEFGFDLDSGEIDLADLESKLDDTVAAVIIQSPNFFGVVENTKAAAALAHRHGALLVSVFTEAVALGLLEPPVDADIVAGELQSFAISPSYGGPFAGVLAKLAREFGLDREIADLRLATKTRRDPAWRAGIVFDEEFGGSAANQFTSSLIARSKPDFARRYVSQGDPGPALAKGESGEVVGCGRVERVLGGDGACGDDPDDIPRDDPFDVGGIRHLLADGDAVALRNEFGDVAVDAVVGYAGERHAEVLAHRLRGEGDREFFRDEAGVIIERLVEIAQAEEEDGVGVALLQFQVLSADRRGHAARSGTQEDGLL